MFTKSFRLFIQSVGLTLLLWSCTGSYNIEGVIKTFGYEGRELSLIEFLPSHTTKYDSCVVSHGHFEMKGHVDSVRLLFLCKDGQPVIPVYLEKGRTRIEIMPDQLNVWGTHQNDLFHCFLKKKVAIDNRYEDMFQKRLSLSPSCLESDRGALIQDSLRMIVDECEDMIFSFMSTNYSEPAAVGVFMMLSVPNGTNSVSPLLKRILDSAPDDFLNNSYVSGYIEHTGYVR